MALFGKKFSRRDFLTVSGMAAAALTLEWTRITALAAAIGDKSKYPVVVIGSGQGGLTAAACLARQGFPVTVLEQHEIPGGYATSFDREEGQFTFEVSLHATVPPQDILEQAGILDRVEAVLLPELCRIVTPDYDLIWPQTDPEEGIRLLAEKFPEEARGIRGFLGELLAVAGEMKKLSANRGRFIKVLFPLTYPAMWGMRTLTLAGLLEKHVKDPRLKGVLSVFWGYYGLPPSRLAAFYYAIATGGYLKAGAFYYRRRSQDLSNALVEAIEKNGGRVLLETEAREILLREGAVAGVKTANGKIHEARAVFSNASAPETFERLLSAEALPKEYRERLRPLRPSISSFVVWLGLNRELDPGIKGYEIFLFDHYDPEDQYRACLAAEAERVPLSVTLYDRAYPGYSRPGRSTVTIMFVCGYEPWKPYEADYFAGRKEAYRKEKERLARVLIRRTEARLIPGLSSLIQVMEAATPLTNRRFTRNPEGAIYGYEQSLDNAFMNRLPSVTPIKGLFLAGAWGNPGGGFEGVQRAGLMAFGALMKEWGGE